MSSAFDVCIMVLDSIDQRKALYSPLTTTRFLLYPSLHLPSSLSFFYFLVHRLVTVFVVSKSLEIETNCNLDRVGLEVVRSVESSRH